MGRQRGRQVRIGPGLRRPRNEVLRFPQSGQRGAQGPVVPVRLMFRIQSGRDQPQGQAGTRPGPKSKLSARPARSLAGCAGRPPARSTPSSSTGRPSRPFRPREPARPRPPALTPPGRLPAGPGRWRRADRGPDDVAPSACLQDSPGRAGRSLGTTAWAPKRLLGNRFDRAIGPLPFREQVGVKGCQIRPKFSRGRRAGKAVIGLRRRGYRPWRRMEPVPDETGQEDSRDRHHDPWQQAPSSIRHDFRAPR